MKKERFVAYNDAVLAIIVTIMVLSLPQPKAANWASIWALRTHFAAYAISFLQVTILWITHHNFFNLVKKIDRVVLGLNALMLFTVSLLPYATEFVGNHVWSLTAQLFYGVVFVTFSLILTLILVEINRRNLIEAQHKTVILDKRKLFLDYAIKVLGFVGAIFFPPAILISALLDSLIWIIPDRRTEVA